MSQDLGGLRLLNEHIDRLTGQIHEEIAELRRLLAAQAILRERTRKYLRRWRRVDGCVKRVLCFLPRW